MCPPTLWSQDILDRSILRVLDGDDGEETLLSRTSGTGIKIKTHCILEKEWSNHIIWRNNSQNHQCILVLNISELKFKSFLFRNGLRAQSSISECRPITIACWSWSLSYLTGLLSVWWENSQMMLIFVAIGSVTLLVNFTPAIN